MEVTQTQRRVIYTSRKLWWFLSDLTHSSLIWLGRGLIWTYNISSPHRADDTQWSWIVLIWLWVTTPMAKLCQSTTYTDGPAVLKNAPPGFYCPVVWGTVTAQGAWGLDMGMTSPQSSHGLAKWDASTPSKRKDNWACLPPEQWHYWYSPNITFCKTWLSNVNVIISFLLVRTLIHFVLQALGLCNILMRLEFPCPQSVSQSRVWWFTVPHAEKGKTCCYGSFSWPPLYSKWGKIRYKSTNQHLLICLLPLFWLLAPFSLTLLPPLHLLSLSHSLSYWSPD